MVLGHCGSIGHRGKVATESITNGKSEWRGKVYIRKFVQSCLYCLISHTREKIRRHLASARHEQQPTHVVHMEYLYIEKTNKDDPK